MGNGHVFTAYCHGGTVDQPFMDAWSRCKRYDDLNRKILAVEANADGLYVVMNRNKAAEDFLKSNCEWFWSLDTDVVFQPDAIYKLIDSAHPVDRPIVSALYFGYIGETASLMQPVPIWFDEKPDGMPYVVGDLTQGQLRPLKNIGFGCVVIHRSVFEKMDEHYGVVEHDGKLYRNDFVWFGHDPIFCDEQVEYGGHTFWKLVHSGEDVTFCQRARKLGFPIYGNPDVTTNHLKKRFENVATFQMGPYIRSTVTNGQDPGDYLEKVFREEMRALGIKDNIVLTPRPTGEKIEAEPEYMLAMKRAAERLLASYGKKEVLSRDE